MDSYLTTDDANPRVAARSSRRAQTRPARGGRTTFDHAEPAPEPTADRQGERLARALGWLSIGLGLAEVVAPLGVARLVGLRPTDANRRLLRGVGMREIASGIGILSQGEPTPWVWSRVAGDALDLGLLGLAMRSENAQRGRVVAATAAVLGVTALGVYCGTQLHRNADATRRMAPQTIPSRSRLL